MSDREQLWYLINGLLNGTYSTNVFCHEFTRIYDLETDYNHLLLLERTKFAELSEILGGPESKVIGILFGLSRDIDGMMMFVLSMESAKQLIGLLLGSEPGEEFNEMEISTLKEIGNIISGAYVYSLSELCNISIWTSVPYVAMDMAGAVLSVPAIEIARTADKALTIETLFNDGVNKIDGYFILIPEEESYMRILSKLGVN